MAERSHKYEFFWNLVKGSICGGILETIAKIPHNIREVAIRVVSYYY